MDALTHPVIPVNFTRAELETLATMFTHRAARLQLAGLKAQNAADLAKINDAWKANHRLAQRFSEALGCETFAIPTRAAARLGGNGFLD